MKVQDLTEYSDHKPQSLEIRYPQITVDQSQPLESKYQPAPCRFLFHEDNKACFMETQKISTSMHTMQIHNENLETITNSDNLNTLSITHSVNELNNKFSEHIRNIASTSFKQTKNNPKKKKKANNPWFNLQSRLAKRELKKATKVASEFPTIDNIRRHYYRVKGKYKRLLKKTERKYFENINKDLEDGKILNWQSFKRLKKHKTDKIDFDSHDMHIFENFSHICRQITTQPLTTRRRIHLQIQLTTLITLQLTQ